MKDLLVLQSIMLKTTADRVSFAQATIATVAIFGFFLLTSNAYATATTLSVTVNTAISFSVTTQNFSTITPGTPSMATTTLFTTTNDAAGWIVTLSGDNKATGQNNLQRTGEAAVQITDQTEWIPGAATTSAGNAVRIASLANSGNVLAFRVATATTTNGTAFTSSTWWGTTDSYMTDAATTLYAGIASSTVARTIGNAGTGSFSSSEHLNEVQYYLNVSAAQKTGAYTAPLTYTATGN